MKGYRTWQALSYRLFATFGVRPPGFPQHWTWLDVMMVLQSVIRRLLGWR